MTQHYLRGYFPWSYKTKVIGVQQRAYSRVTKVYLTCHVLAAKQFTWWRHQIQTFSALLAICAGNSPVPGEFPTQRPVTRSFGVFFDLRLNNGWANNGEAGDMRRYRAHYDVNVMDARKMKWGRRYYQIVFLHEMCEIWQNIHCNLQEVGMDSGDKPGNARRN